ncbi:MAG: translocation/assembly module TamB domain-containing protein, partial [Bacteriovoracaceae bacterium]|nr:translocation/assembly module TamB domain-containing protein [Bacteriovoracaceae bacterium]
IKINGKVKEFSTDLTSDPALSQTDIFSLLAFGYTQDKSQALSNNQGAAASSLGIGGFLVDKLKINDNLKSSLGLKVSLAPEVLEGGGSYLDGRSNTANSSRVTRATKVQVKKEIAKDVNLAVSSTVGGTIGQRQSMNLNYNINKNVSAEGVYELKTNDEGIEDVIDTSIGGDLKFKWTFK